MDYRRWLYVVAVVAALVIVVLVAIPVLAPEDVDEDIGITPTVEPTAAIEVTEAVSEPEPADDTDDADGQEEETTDGDALFSPDGRWSVVVGSSDLLWLFDGTGEPQRPLADSSPDDLEAPAAFSDNLLAIARGDQVRVWDLDTGEGFDLSPVDGAPLSLLAVGPADDVVAAYGCRAQTDTGCAEGIILLWNVADGALRHTLDVQLATVETLELESGDVLAAAGCETPACDEPSILLWNTVSGSPIDMVETPAN